MSNQRNILTIVPPPVNENGLMVGRQAQVCNQQGEQIGGVTEVNMEIVPDDVIRARLDVFINLNSEFKVRPFINRMWAQDPTDGEVKYIKRIVFEDGNELQENE